MKKIRQTVIYVPAIVLLFLSLTVLAQAAGSGEALKQNNRHRQRRGEDFINSLGLTPQQQVQIQEHRETVHKERLDFKERLREKRRELQQELEKPVINKEKIKGITDEIKIIMGEQFDQRVENIIFMRQVLTPEQFKEFSDREHRDKKRKRIHKQKPPDCEKSEREGSSG